VPLKPFTAVIVTVPLLVNPGGSARVAGWNNSVKLGAVTVSAMVAVAVSVPEAPVTTTEYVPVAAVLLALKARELLLVVLAGVKAAVTPLGNPAADRLTLPLKPFLALIVIVLLPLPARGTVSDAVEAARVKLGTTTVNPIVAVLLNVPEIPVIVTG
jgi:uncharacterized membrane protein